MGCEEMMGWEMEKRVHPWKCPVHACAGVHVCPGILYCTCDGAPGVPTFGMVTTRWPVVWDLLAVLTSGETSSDKAS